MHTAFCIERLIFSILKSEAACSSKMLVTTYKTKKCCNPKDYSLRIHGSENLKCNRRRLLVSPLAKAVYLYDGIKTIFFKLQICISKN
jgi:hypothetical protein